MFNLCPNINTGPARQKLQQQQKMQVYQLCNSKNVKNTPVQQNCLNFWTDDSILMPFKNLKNLRNEELKEFLKV